MFKLLSRLYFLQNLLGSVVSRTPGAVTHNLGKYLAIKKAFYLTALEDLQGDYLEFGVFTGSSFCCALQCAKRPGVKGAHTNMRFVGFDSFSGFGTLTDEEKHPFYTDLNFTTDFDRVQRRVAKVAGARKQHVKLVKGFFSESCRGVAPSTYGLRQAAVVLIDNDTYSGALDCLRFCTPILQQGTIFVVDDAFSYRGATDKGVKGALNTWLSETPGIKLRKVGDYGMGGEILIVAKTDSHTAPSA